MPAKQKESPLCVAVNIIFFQPLMGGAGVERVSVSATA